MSAPTLAHAIGNRRDPNGEVVRLHPVRGMVYRFVTCEHPREFLEAIQWCCGPSHWIETDDGTMLQLAHVVEVAVVPDPRA